MKKAFWSADKIVSFVAMGISLLTLFIFIKQTNVIEKQSHLSIMPYLLIESTTDASTNKFLLYLINHGVGPAIIESVKIRSGGKTYDGPFEDYWQRYLPNADSLIFSRSSLNPGFAIPAGGKRNLIIAGGNPQRFEAFMGIVDSLVNGNFDLDITYRSIYGDRWKIRLKENVPEQL